MAMDRSRYPTNWDEISYRIRFERAGGKCEQCGLPHGAIVARYELDKSQFLLWDEKKEQWLDGYDGKPIQAPDSQCWDDYGIEKPTKIILTTHHKGAPKPDGSPGDVHDKMDCRDENLVALCQRCHWMEDLPYHKVSARIARRANKRKRQLEAGQMELFQL